MSMCRVKFLSWNEGENKGRVLKKVFLKDEVRYVW